MSPRFYGYVWAIYFIVAAVAFFAGLMSPLNIVMFGFTAFGLIFMGMMCVLPGMSSHAEEKISTPVIAEQRKIVPTEQPASARLKVA